MSHTVLGPFNFIMSRTCLRHLSLASTRQLFDNFVTATLKTSKGPFMNLIITMRFMKKPLSVAATKLASQAL